MSQRCRLLPDAEQSELLLATLSRANIASNAARARLLNEAGADARAVVREEVARLGLPTALGAPITDRVKAQLRGPKFSAYQALSGRNPEETRKWLMGASARELYDEAASDLTEAYGLRFPLHAQALDITVRGHAMASPLRGFLDNAGIRALRRADRRILFAHSDLSGYSVFEEAAWWGYKAAQKLLG